MDTITVVYVTWEHRGRNGQFQLDSKEGNRLGMMTLKQEGIQQDGEEGQ